MVNHETNGLFFESLEIPEESRIGLEGEGFKYILDGLNAERTLIAAECIGDGYWFLDRVTKYVRERVVFGGLIGQSQGVQYPIADAYIEVEAANLMCYKACELLDAGLACGAQANMAKYLAAKASWEAAAHVSHSPVASVLPMNTTWSARSGRPALPGGSDFDRPDLFLRCRAFARLAAFVLTAAVAVTQSLGSSGAQLLTACVLGHEEGIRVGESLGCSHYRVLHTTVTAGTLAAAAAVGNLLGLSPSQMLHAFGSAGTQSAEL